MHIEPDDGDQQFNEWAREQEREWTERFVEHVRAVVASGRLKGAVIGVANKVIRDRGTHKLSANQLRAFDRYVPRFK